MRPVAFTLALSLGALTASAAPFTVTLSNTSTNNAKDWSTGLLTLSPTIALGLAPQPGDAAYSTYAFTNNQCDVSDGYCQSPGCSDNGNAAVLAQRLGLTLNVNAWLVPAINNGSSATVSFDAPTGSRLSYIAWVTHTSVIDDFVAMHPVGDKNTLSIPLFDAGGQPLPSLSFEISGYDSNSTSATNGSGASCASHCPPPANPACYVALGNASYGATGNSNLPAPAPPPIVKLTALSGDAQSTLRWTNAQPHEGAIVVRRRGSAVNWAPTNGTTYTAGQSFSVGGGGRNYVVYADGASPYASSFLDSGAVAGPLQNDVAYYYKVFAYTGSGVSRVYASGSVPTSSGLFSTPTSGVSPSPRWCYSVGLLASMQPVIARSSGVFHVSQSANITALNPDGTERFRPVTLDAAVQGRFLAVPLQGRSGVYLVVGDGGGKVYVLNADNGSVVWSGAVTTAIMAQPAIQLYASSNAAFQAAHPGRDLIFVASRITGSASNTVTALSSVDGSTVWQYAPGDLGYISGGMLLDRANNRLWVASRSAGGGATVRVVSSLNGSLVATFPGLADVDFPVSWGYGQNDAVVTANDGTVRGFDLSSLTQEWNLAVGAQASYAFTTNDGFIASLTSGQVQRYLVGADGGVNPMWSPPAGMGNPRGPRIDYVNQRALEATGDGGIKEIDVVDGGIGKTLTVSAAGVGVPNLDSTLSPQRMYVPTNDGRICAYDVPF